MLPQVVITKMDGHAKGGGALSAVAATGSPIVFLGTGEHFDELDVFNAESFVKRLLGMGDMEGLTATIKDAGLEEKSKALMTKITTGATFQLRDLREQYESVLSLGPLSKVMQMMPGMQSAMLPPGQEAEGKKRLKRFMTMLDSMTELELDNYECEPLALAPADLFCVRRLMCGSSSRIKRVAYGSGAHIGEVHMMLEQYLQMQKMFGKMKVSVRPLTAAPPIDARDQGMDKAMRSKNASSPKNMAGMTNQIASMMNPEMVKQMGGMEGLQAMMKVGWLIVLVG